MRVGVRVREQKRGGMKLLPNLSSLGVNNKSKRREEAVGAPFVPSTTPVNVTQFDWVQLFEAISTQDVEIEFTISWNLFKRVGDARLGVRRSVGSLSPLQRHASASQPL